MDILKYFGGLFDKIRNFNVRDIDWNDSGTWLKIGVGVVAIVAAVVILNWVVGVVLGLAPWIILAVVAFIAYKWLTSRDTDDDIVEYQKEKAKPKNEEKTVAAQQFEDISRNTHDVELEQASEMTVSELVQGNDSQRLETMDEIDDFVEPDLSRLEAEENKKPVINDEVLSQIEERKRRLQNQG